MTKKYKLTKTTKTECGITFYQIEALRDINDVSKGDKGGWVEKKDNLNQNGDAWVSGNARVYGNARVSGDAWVCGNVRVFKQKLIEGYFCRTKQKSEKSQ